MPNLLVIHDLDDPCLAQSLLTAANSSGSVISLSTTAFAVSTDHSASETFERLHRLVDAQDSIYVVALSDEYAAQGPSVARQWFDENFEPDF